MKRKNKQKINITTTPKICLCMIVKNESKIIKRCLDSAKSIIDYISICDTGSTDNTPQIITDWYQENNIPGTVHHEPFQSFGHNRTISARLAHETYPEADYLLLLDADMILEVQSNFSKSKLQSDEYHTIQYNQSIKYWNTRLIKASLPWKSVGVTHEYWDTDENTSHTRDNLNSLVIQDQEDGGSKSDKFERDKRLLIAGLDDSDTSTGLKARYSFYLAQTLSALGELEDSISWYKKRIMFEGWSEEVFYSLLQIGNCYERLAQSYALQKKTLGDSNNHTNLTQKEEECISLAATYYLESWEARPIRAEPLYHLAKLYRLRSKNNVSLMYALKGKEIPYPKNDILFVNYHVYEYLFDYEISICAYYTDHRNSEGIPALKRLTKKLDQLPKYIADSVKDNSKFYTSV